MSRRGGEMFLVTGADGFVGARAVRALVDSGCRVRAVSLEERPVRIADLKDSIEYVCADVADPVVIERVIDGADFVLHFAARGVVWNPAETFEELVNTNLLGTHRLITEAGRRGAKKVVVAGSVFEYGYSYGRAMKKDLGADMVQSPINLYGVTKAASTLVAAHAGDEAGIETETLRIFSPYGPAEQPNRFVPSVIGAALRRKSVRMTEGLQERDFCFVDDIVRAFIAAARTVREFHGIFNLGTGRALSLRRAAEIIVSRLGSGSEILAGEVPYRENEAFRLVADPAGLPENLRSCLGTAFEEGVLRMAEWWRTNEKWWNP